jgi:hypothetical protein
MCLQCNQNIDGNDWDRTRAPFSFINMNQFEEYLSQNNRSERENNELHR